MHKQILLLHEHILLRIKIRYLINENIKKYKKASIFVYKYALSLALYLIYWPLSNDSPKSNKIHISTISLRFSSWSDESFNFFAIFLPPEFSSYKNYYVEISGTRLLECSMFCCNEHVLFCIFFIFVFAYISISNSKYIFFFPSYDTDCIANEK